MIISPPPHTKSRDHFFRFVLTLEKVCFFFSHSASSFSDLTWGKKKQQSYKRTEFNSANYESNIAESPKSQKKDLFSVRKREKRREGK